nr:glutamyl-tRNA reductase [Candidatus Desulfatibia profunda]
MDDIVLLGMNHKTALVELRECLAFSHEETLAALDKFKASPAISEVLVISTCNRIEVLMAAANTPTALET